MASKKWAWLTKIFAGANAPVHLSLHSYLRGWQLCFCIVLYYFVQAAVSVIRNSEVVRYSGAALVLNMWRYRLVHIAVSIIW